MYSRNNWSRRVVFGVPVERKKEEEGVASSFFFFFAVVVFLKGNKAVPAV